MPSIALDRSKLLIEGSNPRLIPFKGLEFYGICNKYTQLIYITNKVWAHFERLVLIGLRHIVHNKRTMLLLSGYKSIETRMGYVKFDFGTSRKLEFKMNNWMKSRIMEPDTMEQFFSSFALDFASNLPQNLYFWLIKCWCL